MSRTTKIRGINPIATDADVRAATLAFRRRQSRLRFLEATREIKQSILGEITTDLDEWQRSMPAQQGGRK